MTRALIVSTRHSLERKLTPYDAARYAWRADVQSCRYVVAVDCGRVVAVFEPERWLPATPANFPGFQPPTYTNSWGFEGREVPEMLSYFKARAPRLYSNFRYMDCPDLPR